MWKGILMIEETAPVTREKRSRRMAKLDPPKPKQKRQRKSGAAAEIDKQLAEALKERTVVGKKLAEAAGHNARYQQLSAEINELLNMQARMNGLFSQANQILPVGFPVETHGFQVGGGVPSGVGSIPTRTPVVTP